ncbi:DUF6202 family protein [Streptosporangium canum]|uniref:DUF6202 family protein n=1 Tax=Streptosporangium canum TaxID=324952 RepID=UPI0037AD49B4
MQRGIVVDITFDEQLSDVVRRAGLCRPENRFFQRARALESVEADAALTIARHWQAITKAFMFTTISSLGVMARGFSGQPAPDREVLGAFQTAFRVIGDDLDNFAPEFNSVSPDGAAGIHYLWWEDSIVAPLAALAPGAHAQEPAEGVRELLANMDRLAGSHLGAAVQLRVVETIALDIAVAFRRIFSRVLVDGGKVFASAGSLAWIDSHIRAETGHAQSVSDHETGMTVIAESERDRAELVRLATEYVANWARALDHFAALLAR